jgi:hypothetical protein
MTRLHLYVIPSSLLRATLESATDIARSNGMSQLDQPVRYTIRIENSIDDTLASWFGPVQIERSGNAEGRQITTLSGKVVDQAALVGLVRHLHSLGIILLSIERKACAGSGCQNDA